MERGSAPSLSFLGYSPAVIEYFYISTDTDNSVVMAREKGGRGWVEVSKGREKGLSIIVSII